MSPELQNIINRAYEVFSRYQINAPLDVCTDCCLTKSQESELISLSVPTIPYQLLYDYNTAAKTELPDINEFKHFLPRFLELTAGFEFLHHSAELVLSRFEYYNKEEWTSEEAQIMHEFGETFFVHCLSTYPLPDLESIDSILIMLHKANLNIVSLLENWHTVISKESVLHFSDFFTNGFKPHNPKELSSPFADSELSQLTINWLNTDARIQSFTPIIEELIMNPEELSQHKLNELSIAYEYINRGEGVSWF